ncbi:hypothetical protein D3C81_1545740 [compost metagenome]
MTAGDPECDGRGANQDAHTGPELSGRCKHAEHGSREEVHGHEPRITEQDTEVTCQDHVHGSEDQSAALIPEASEIAGDEEG